MKLSEAAQVLVAFGPGERKLLDIIDGWCGHVMTLYEDSVEPGADSWTVHDFIAALYLRDALERGVGSSEHVTVSAVSVADEMFRKMTVQDSDELLSRCEIDLPAHPWWWKRIPTSGPVRDEIEMIVRHGRI